MEVSDARQYHAFGHPFRLRLMFALGRRPATISQLAAELGSRKGNVAHHLKVLREAGLVRVAYTRQVRGGTEQYYERAARRLDFTGGDTTVQSALALRVVADEVAASPEDPFVVLRQLRLTRAQAERLTRTLTELAQGLDEAAAGEPRYGLVLGLYRQDGAAVSD
jgi:DNA-binding transcriptional ArsR family regulator